MWTMHDAPSDRDYLDQLNPPEREEEEEVTAPSSAKRSTKKPLYHLVPIELLRAVAQTRAYGDRKYEPGNWKQGDAEFFIDCLSHAIEHLMRAGDPEDKDGVHKHLGHAACNIAFLLWALERKIVTPEDFATAALIVEER